MDQLSLEGFPRRRLKCKTAQVLIDLATEDDTPSGAELPSQVRLVKPHSFDGPGCISYNTRDDIPPTS
jgi:hypothetical protein